MKKLTVTHRDGVRADREVWRWFAEPGGSSIRRYMEVLNRSKPC
jgi:hypothetical protein